MRIAFVASAVPRRCGIATFTADLMAAVKAADPAVRCVAAAIDEPNTARPYGPDVRWRIKQGDKESYRAAARAIMSSAWAHISRTTFDATAACNACVAVQNVPSRLS